MTADSGRWTRRELLVRGAWGAAWLGTGLTGGIALLPAACTRATGLGIALEESDENGLRLRPGFRSRIIATSGEPVASTGYVWHYAPDGGAVFATPDGGWIYVSNAEIDDGAGGVGAIRFDQAGEIVDAYSILDGTNRNCAGGATPWKTWLSCEEVAAGMVYECDPYTPNSQGIKRPALGVFQHEAVAVDPTGERLYLTEDKPDGLLYRFSPSNYPDLSSGTLEAAQILDPDEKGRISPGERRSVAWHSVTDPSATKRATRYQVTAATPFDGGEGCDYERDLVFFTTKGDDRVWRLDPRANEIEILYDRGDYQRRNVASSEDEPSTARPATLSGVDNLLALPNGNVLVAEDPGDQQIVVLSSEGVIEPLVQVIGHLGSEVTGPAMSPDGTRLYFSSQRNPGTTFEVTGPFQ